MRTLLAIALVAAFASSASAEDFDPRGWKLLGKHGISDEGAARITLRNYDGNLDELRIVLDGGKVTIDGATVDKANMDDVFAAINVTLGSNRPSISIDLTDNQDTLENVTLGVPHVQGPGVIRVYGRDRRKPELVGTSDDAAFVDDDWKPIGTTKLDGSHAGTLQLSDTRAWPALAFVSRDSDLDVLAVNFKTSTGEWIPYLTMKFRSGSRTITVDLPANTSVASIEFEYTILGDTEAQLDVFGMPKAVEVPSTELSADGAVRREIVYADTVKAEPIDEPEPIDAPDPKPRTLITLRNANAPAYDPDGWTLLGEDDVDLVEDEIEVRRKKSTWSEIKVVVDGDEVTLASVELELAGKAKKVQREQVEEAYGEGAERVIAIAGKRRAIEKVRLQYKKHRLDASTRVQIYAR